MMNYTIRQSSGAVIVEKARIWETARGLIATLCLLFVGVGSTLTGLFVLIKDERWFLGIFSMVGGTALLLLLVLLVIYRDYTEIDFRHDVISRSRSPEWLARGTANETQSLSRQRVEIQIAGASHNNGYSVALHLPGHKSLEIAHLMTAANAKRFGDMLRDSMLECVSGDKTELTVAVSVDSTAEPST